MKILEYVIPFILGFFVSFLWVASIYDNYIADTIERTIKEVRIEAVAHGAAQWTVDKEGNIEFEWIKE